MGSDMGDKDETEQERRARYRRRVLAALAPDMDVDSISVTDLGERLVQELVTLLCSAYSEGVSHGR